ncbi:MAG: type 4a pilus biogenesis protein PilO [Phycisphaeraceae bacterium]|nr:type 4a pilus biogenesis protein PilO [Phycisphaeraceae bacterium]
MKLNDLYDHGVMPIHLGGSALCAVMLLVGWVYGLGPLMSESHQATSIIEQAEQAEAQAKQAKQQLDQVFDELQLVEQQLDEHPFSLHSATQINPLLAELAQWSELHNLSITRTNAGRREALTYYDYVPIQVSGEGGYNDFLSMLQRIHNGRGDLGVITFGVSSSPASGGVAFEIELAWYVLSDDMQEEPAAGPTAVVPTR